MQSLDQSLAWNIRTYLSLTPAYREIARYLYFMECKRLKQGLLRLFMKKRRMACFAKCSMKTVQRFNSHAKLFLGFKIIVKFRNNGSRTTNDYIFDTNLFKAMNWLDQRNLLRANKDKIEKLVEEAQIFEERQAMSIAPPHRECPYPSLTLSQTLNRTENRSLYPRLEKIGIDQRAKEYINQLPEAYIIRTIEDCMWYYDKNKPDNLSALFMRRARHYKERIKI